jgi:hypothetical protein
MENHLEFDSALTEELSEFMREWEKENEESSLSLEPVKTRSPTSC